MVNHTEVGAFATASVALAFHALGLVACVSPPFQSFSSSALPTFEIFPLLLSGAFLIVTFCTWQGSTNSCKLRYKCNQSNEYIKEIREI